MLARLGRGCLVALLVLLPALASAAPDGAAGGALERPLEPIALRCRDGSGPWSDCSLLVERLGERWSLLLDGQRLEFRHDGRGAVTMQRPSPADPLPAWIPVEARWTDDPALCWNGVCAQGELPLD